MKAEVKWAGEARFDGKSETGHTIIMDGAPEFGGQNQGCRPMELLLLGMGGCSAFDVVLILKKSRQEITDCLVQIEADRAETEPRIFTKIHAHFVVTGKNLSAKHVDRAVHLSAEKYCSASIMLGKTAEITHDFEIVET
jgi:putative redox protein